MLGVGCVVIATVTSGFAGVYFEKARQTRNDARTLLQHRPLPD